MKVFFDARYTRFPVHDGVSRYGAELLGELLKVRDDVTAIICDQRQLQNLPEGVPYVTLNKPTSPKEPFIARQLNALGADVVFSPLQTMGSRGKKYKLILTIHDLIYYTYRTPPASFSLPVRLLWRLFHLSYTPERFILNKADAVVSVSKTTEQEIERHHLTTRPITVIPNAVDPAKFTHTNGPTSKTLVYMGSFVPYKNVDTLVRAMSLLPAYTLNVCSRISDDERERLTGLADNPKQLIFVNGASDAQYHELLARATAFVTASKLEGFGIPLLEAQAAGTPVLCSDIHIFHEVAAESALYFDPSSPEQLAAHVIALENVQTRATLIAHGSANLARYSWANSARTLSDLIDTV